MSLFSKRSIVAALTLAEVLRRIWRARRGLSFSGRRCVVVGGTRGLGIVLVRALVARGARVAVLARGVETLPDELAVVGCAATSPIRGRSRLVSRTPPAAWAASTS
jgi:NAD(P)-dependent dehydrogenase (short-subunit alcohol dehydrogenase family)